MAFHPARYAKMYEGWHDNIRDWCISRQLWWGHRIPVWSRTAKLGQLEWLQRGIMGGDSTGDPATIAEAQRLVAATPVRVFRLKNGTEYAIRWALDGDNVTISVCPSPQAAESPEWRGEASELSSIGFVEDPDVLDTWFSSALWPMSTMGWPDADAAAKETGVADFPSLLPAFNPTSTLCTAREIITLWVSRMVMFNRYFMGEGQGKGPLPYRDVYIHCVVQDGQGRKMSKSLGNGVDPLDIIASHGTDAMRFTICQMATQTQDVRLPVKKDSVTGKNTSDKFDLGRNFANKVWNAASFALRNLTAEAQRDAEREGELSLPDRWMLSRLAAGVAEVEGALKNFEFSSYGQTVYDLLWRDFCDWYLEAIKPTVAGDAGQRTVLRATLDTILRLLHPIMPYVTEAIFEQVRGIEAGAVKGVTLGPARKGKLLATAAWPTVDASLRDEGAERDFERMRGLVTAIREVRAQHNVQPRRRVTLHAPALAMSWLRAVQPLVATLAGLEAASDQPPGGPSVEFVCEGTEYRLSDLADAGGVGVDSGAEKARLTKLIADLEKSVETFEGRLQNPGYAAKAPPAMVQQTKDQLEKARAELGAARKALEGLGG